MASEGSERTFTFSDLIGKRVLQIQESLLQRGNPSETHLHV